MEVCSLFVRAKCHRGNVPEQTITQPDKTLSLAVGFIEKLVLIEIGPRFALNPIKAFEGSMGGEALW